MRASSFDHFGFALGRRPVGYDGRCEALIFATWAMIAFIVALGAFVLVSSRR
jgi:hypothetical protein